MAPVVGERDLGAGPAGLDGAEEGSREEHHAAVLAVTLVELRGELLRRGPNRMTSESDTVCRE